MTSPQIRKFPSKTVYRIVVAAMLSFTSPLALHAQQATVQQQYKVAAGDVLAITVYGDTGLTGDFPVSVDGTIGYPILGSVSVRDKTTAEIGAILDSSLREHVANLAVSVMVKQYAPVFILGDVRNPGKYEFRPGMIALEVFALGGGPQQADKTNDTAGMQLVAARQAYEDTALDLMAKDVRRARLEAEMNDKPFEYHPESNGLLQDQGVIKDMVAAEQNIFAMRLSVIDTDRRNLVAQRDNYGEEIETLEKSTSLRNEQFGLLKQDFDASQGLVSKGAAPEAVLRERKRDLLTMNQQMLEGGAFLARARQNQNEIERKIGELDNKRRNDAAGELRDVDIDIMRLKKRLEFTVQSMAEIGAAAQRVSTREKTVRTQFTAMRMVDGQYQQIALKEDSFIQAGDIVTVRMVLDVADVASKADR